MINLSPELFVDALHLVLHKQTDLVKQTITSLLDIYEEENANSSYTEDSFFDLYASLISSVIEQNITITSSQEIDALLLKLKTNPKVIKDPELFSTLKKIFTDTAPMSDDRYKEYLKRLTNSIIWYTDSRILKKMFGKLVGNSALTDPEKQSKVIEEISSMCTEMARMNKEATEKLLAEEDPKIVNLVDFSDKENIKKAFKSYKDTTVTNMMVTGWQGLNKALGGGWRLGESIVFNAPQFSGKSLMLLNMARWQITYNKPPAGYKNPTCLFYSLENETPQNIKLLFISMYSNKYKALPPEDLTDDQIVDFVFDEIKANGWHFFMDRKLGAEFGFPELVRDFENYVAQGFTPLMCVIDYMNMMRKGKGILQQNDRNDLLIRELYTNVRNYLASHNCSLVTAHQLNREAAKSTRLNPLGAVKKFDVSMLSDSTDPQREMDVGIFQAKEMDAYNRAWLTFKLDKHRYDTTTPEKDKYFAYMFDGPIGILDDINDKNRSVTNINAVPFDGSVTPGEASMSEGIEVF